MPNPLSRVFSRLRRVLETPLAYRLFRRLVSGHSWPCFINEYVRAQEGNRVLDIGCGPGDLVVLLPQVAYYGFDVNPRYIAEAQRRYGQRGQFFCQAVSATAVTGEAPFDLVLAIAVLHHLSDPEASSLFELAFTLLKPSGRLITFDGCFVPGQGRAARFLLSHDRGKYVRNQEEYVRLASQFFPAAKAELRHDYLRIPYTHLIMQCQKQGTLNQDDPS